ncbi:MAG TPA: ornithine carbamoyltransferase [Blastocatellia bacterium]|jgi:ornithine carbamoyltransferase
MIARHFLSLTDIGPDNLCRLIDKSLAIAAGPEKDLPTLEGKIVGIYFKGSSTRTRTAFSTGALRLGGQIIQYGPTDLQLATGETFQDTGQVLSGYLDILVMRSNESLAEMSALAEQSDMAVINAMSKNEHPTQAVADLVTIREALGRLQDVHVLYVGEGNNTACALAFAVAQTCGMRLTLITPQHYGLPDGDLDRANTIASRNGAVIEQHHDIDKPPRNVDVVYTTRWETMGVPKPDTGWRAKFAPYRVSSDLMRKVSKTSQTIFLHDLPAVRGAEVEGEVLDGPQSWAFRQAKHKLTSAMAILDWCATGSIASTVYETDLIAENVVVA